MIYDIIENLKLYCNEDSNLFKAVKYATEFDLSQKDGEYEVEGRRIFAKVQEYQTSPAQERKFESHRDYFDVQVVREGIERHDIALSEELEPLTEYDPQKDVIKLKAPQIYSSIIVKPGMFAVYYPQDIHRPNCNVSGRSNVRKICMKVKI